MAAGDITISKIFQPGVLVGVYTRAHFPRHPSDVVPDPSVALATGTVDSNSSVAFTSLAETPHVAIEIPRNEVQTLTVNATAGTFRLRYGNETTGDLAFNVSAANLKTALVAFAAFTASDLTVTGGPGDSGGTTPYVITFAGAYAGTDPATLEVVAGSVALSGGGAVASVAVTTPAQVGGSRFVTFVPDPV